MTKLYKKNIIEKKCGCVILYKVVYVDCNKIVLQYVFDDDRLIF